MKPEITEYVRVPRAGHLRFPQGNPIGEAGRPDQQSAILRALLDLAVSAPAPETIVRLPYRWRQPLR